MDLTVNNLDQARTALSRELDQISQANDQTWFYVQPDGTLGLYDRPTTIWGVFCEYVYRFFQNPYAQLQNRVTALNVTLQSYLSQEGNEKVRKAFVAKYGGTITTLYQACDKLETKGHTHGLNIDPRLRSEITSELRASLEQVVKELAQINFLKDFRVKGSRFSVTSEGKFGFSSHDSTGQNSQLQHKMRSLTSTLNSYLTAERDEKKLRDFLWKCTETFNALYHVVLRDLSLKIGVKPNDPVSQWMLRSGAANMLFLKIKNHDVENHSLTFKTDSMPQIIKIFPQKQHFLAATTYLGVPYELDIDGESLRLPCQYADSLCTVGLQANRKQVVQEPLSRTIFEFQGQLGTVQQLNLVFNSKGEIEANAQHSDNRSVAIQNDGARYLWVKITFSSTQKADSTELMLQQSQRQWVQVSTELDGSDRVTVTFYAYNKFSPDSDGPLDLTE